MRDLKDRKPDRLDYTGVSPGPGSVPVRAVLSVSLLTPNVINNKTSVLFALKAKFLKRRKV